MTTQTVTLQVDQATAEIVRGLMAKAETAGKSIAALFEELKTTGQPLTLSLNDGEMVIMQDAASYQKLLAELDHAEAVAGIRRGLEAKEAGRTRPVSEFLAELREEFGFPESRPDQS
jgi:PHD/YefM family antitoxin component YafN of YafNO toxin-antitoxin module